MDKDLSSSSEDEGVQSEVHAVEVQVHRAPDTTFKEPILNEEDLYG